MDDSDHGMNLAVGMIAVGGFLLLMVAGGILFGVAGVFGGAGMFLILLGSLGLSVEIRKRRET